MRATCLICALILLTVDCRLASARGAVPDQIEQIHAEGNELFEKATDLRADRPGGARQLYAEAAVRFESVVEQGGVRNGRLFYNLGNTYFLAGDMGHAMLNYRRAERYLPGDVNLMENLAFVRRQRIDKIAAEEENRPLKVLLFWHYDLTPAMRAALFAIAYLSIWGSATWCLTARRSEPRWGVYLGIVASLLLAGSLLFEAYQDRGIEQGVVLASEIVARKGDAATYQPAFDTPLHAGTEFLLIESRADWAHIELTDGRACWVPVESVGLVRERGARDER